MKIGDFDHRGSHFYLKLGIILVKNIHVIRVVFQDQAMYALTSFRGACKNVQNWKKKKKKKRPVCLVIVTNFGKDMTKNACKNAYFIGSIFIPGKYMFIGCVLKVLLRGTRMISSLKYKCPRPRDFDQNPWPAGWSKTTWTSWYTNYPGYTNPQQQERTSQTTQSY